MGKSLNNGKSNSSITAYEGWMTATKDKAKKKAIEIGGVELTVNGRIRRVIMAKEEWDIDIESPQAFINELKSRKVKGDLFTFVQRLPHFTPEHQYWMEMDNVAAIPISHYNYWWTKQVTQQVRNKVRKSAKKGVKVKIDNFDDEFVRRIKDVYDDCPIRQGEKFSDYKKPFEIVKEENATFLDRAEFLCAYHGDELIGFIKLVYTEGFARTMGALGKISQRDKAPMNALVAKAVEICAEKKVPFLTYGKFIYGKKGADSLTIFKRDMGFQKYDLPRYFVPLTNRGKIFLALGIHRRCNEILPSWMVKMGLDIRRKLVNLKYGSGR